MRKFFDENVLLQNDGAKELYQAVKNLPIIDYHCHLDPNLIKEDFVFSDIGELWLSGDHYKWRAMRLCGIDENYITGRASYKEKFLKYASILPGLAGNPLYYWTHMELKALFGINEPLNANSAERIYDCASEQLKTLSVQTMLKKFRVEFVATTDDPRDDLKTHGKYGNTIVSPTFRPDACFASGMDKKMLETRLDYFISRGAEIADHGFDNIGENTSDLEWLIENCYKRKMILQLHFGTFRNVNAKMYEASGKDSGFDIMRGTVETDKLVELLNRMNTRLGGLPEIILYTLNDRYVKSLAALTGAFPRVRMGAAWWFNDTVEGIKRNLKEIAEYSVLGTHLGMLTDSRSFSSYVRFDFFRRILCSYIGEKVECGEYDKNSAVRLVQNISYYNIKELLKL